MSHQMLLRKGGRPTSRHTSWPCQLFEWNVYVCPPKVPELKSHFLLRWMNLEGKLFLSHICFVQQGFHKVVNDITPSNCSQCSSNRHVSLFRDYAGFKEWCHTLNTQICTDSRQTRTAPWSASENFRWNTETQIREALSCRICLQWALHTWTYVSLFCSYCRHSLHISYYQRVWHGDHDGDTIDPEQDEDIEADAESKHQTEAWHQGDNLELQQGVWFCEFWQQIERWARTHDGDYARLRSLWICHECLGPGAWPTKKYG